MSYSGLVPLVLVAVSLSIWIILILFRGGFWKSNQVLTKIDIPLVDPPMVVAVIPARNEEMTIGRTITSLIEQNYSGEFPIILVNDNSEDDTVAAATVAAQGTDRLTIVNGTPLPDGWTGKMWAVSQGVDTAKQLFPDAEYLLMTDADIHHHTKNLTELTYKATTEKLALTSLMVRLQCESRWEQLLIPAFIFFFQKLYPFPWVNDPIKKTAAAAGGCMLVECNVLESAGGIEQIKDRIIDDCALARLLKGHGPIWLGLTHSTISLRRYSELSEIWQMVCRTAFVQLNHSALQLLGTIFGMAFIYLIPIGGIAFGFLTNNFPVSAFSLTAWALMAITYNPTLSLYKRPTWEACLLPLAALLYTVMTIDSARQYWIGKAPIWKGRRNIS